MKIKLMSEKEATVLAYEFPVWVGELLQESAAGARETVRWFIKTLDAKGYKIEKRIKGE